MYISTSYSLQRGKAKKAFSPNYITHDMAQAHIKDEALPAILCLHSHGTNKTIFQFQIHHIIQALRLTFRFVFVEAPFEVDHAGPGVPPAFADARPFRRWNCGEIAAQLWGVSAEELEDEQRQVRALLAETLERERARGPGIVGIIAFSVSARVATGLCLDKELSVDIKFVIIICGGFPALLLTPENTSPPLDMVSIHIQGTRDPWKAQSAKLLDTYFNSARAKIIKFSSGHEVPAGIKEGAKIAEEVIAAWESFSILDTL